MSKKDDIEDSRLVYTKECGWLDLGHMLPGAAKKLLETLRLEKGYRATVKEVSGGGHRVKMGEVSITKDQISYILYSQEGFIVEFLEKQPYFTPVKGHYLVKRGLNSKQKEEVALAIFKEISIEFENMQSNYVQDKLKPSGFSIEDLPSNIIGFYRAVFGYGKSDIAKICNFEFYPDPKNKSNYLLSQKEINNSKKVYDETGGISSIKNKEFRPINPYTKKHFELPPEFNKLSDIKINKGLAAFKSSNVVRLSPDDIKNLIDYQKRR